MNKEPERLVYFIISISEWIGLKIQVGNILICDLKTDTNWETEFQSWYTTVCIGDSTGDLLLVPPGADDELKREVETTNEV